MNIVSALAPDAEMVLGIASTAMPFARTPEAQAERWLRILRLHGEAGIALQALGVGEGRLGKPVEGRSLKRTTSTRGDDRDMVGQVAAHARRIASQRGVAGVATTDVLLAVMHVYGIYFDRVLQAHGTDRDEVMERLRVRLHPGPGDAFDADTCAQKAQQ
jgi:hypothetical protein